MTKRPLEQPCDPVRPATVADDCIVRVFRVPPENAGFRVDVFIQAQLRNTSRTRARLIVRGTAYAPDGRPLKPSERLSAEQRVVLWRPPLDEDCRTEPLELLHEDSHLIAVDKPALMTVHPTARYHNSTLLKVLEAQRPGEWFSLIHRLDRETSGVLLVARTPAADRGFKRMLEDRSTHGERHGPPMGKLYLAITWGHPPEGDIEDPLEPDTDNPLRVKMRVARRGAGLRARTTVEVLERASGYALVACRLHTGRQHQIRLHLAHHGCPVVGDKLYGPDERLLARAADGELTREDLAELELPRQALHACRYELSHAVTGEPLVIESPLPADLQDFWTTRTLPAGPPAAVGSRSAVTPGQRDS